MPSTNKPLSDKELIAYELNRDLAAELLEAVQQMKASQVHAVLVIGAQRFEMPR